MSNENTIYRWSTPISSLLLAAPHPSAIWVFTYIVTSNHWPWWVRLRMQTGSQYGHLNPILFTVIESDFSIAVHIYSSHFFEVCSSCSSGFAQNIWGHRSIHLLRASFLCSFCCYCCFSKFLPYWKDNRGNNLWKLLSVWIYYSLIPSQINNSIWIFE